MSSTERDFKGVWIPKTLYLDRKLSWTEKILLVEIDCLDKGKGCYASNKYLAKFLGKSPGRIANIISKLRSQGLLVDRQPNSQKRYISLGLGLTKTLRRVNENVKGGLTKTLTQDSNTLFSNTMSGQNEFDHTWAVKLTSLVERRRVIKGRIKLHQWETQFRRLRQRDGVKKTRIRKVIRWFLKNSYEKYVPKIYHSNDLRERFERIEAAMKRKEGGNGELEGVRTLKTTRKGRTTTSGVYYPNESN